jgi:membrane protein DedA with SNARE-associated domain
MNPFLTASLTEPLVNFCTDLIGSIGYAGVFVLMMLGSACVPIPSEATMMFAGFKVSDGDLTLIGIIVAGVLGDLAGCSIAYAAGYYGRIELLERNRLVHVSRKRLDWADSWFQRYGSLTVFFGRMIPLVRAFTSLPAGVARMPLGRFIPLSAAGSVIWVSMLAVVGRAVGDNWEKWRHHLEYLDYAVVAGIIALVAYWLIRRRRAPTDGSSPAAAGPSGVGRHGDGPNQPSVDATDG